MSEEKTYCSMYSRNAELYHHGIKGQKWGVQNGPPYPLGSDVSTGARLKIKSSGKEAKKQIKKDIRAAATSRDNTFIGRASQAVGMPLPKKLFSDIHQKEYEDAVSTVSERLEAKKKVSLLVAHGKAATTKHMTETDEAIFNEVVKVLNNIEKDSSTGKINYSKLNIAADNAMNKIESLYDLEK